MKIKNDKSVTIRLNTEIYDKMIKIAISKSVEKNKIVKISEIIRISLDEFLKKNYEDQ
jgi:predicted DNA-binding protein